MSKTLRKFEGTTTDYSVHGLVEVPMERPAPNGGALKNAALDNPVVPWGAQHLANLRIEVAVKAQRLRPTQFMAQIEQERKGNLPGSAAESHVRKTRSHPEPHLDAHDRSLKRWEKDYEKGLRKALAALELCVGIEAEVMLPVRRASKRESLLAIGEISETAVECSTCHGDVEPNDVSGAGECDTCDRYRRRHDGEPRPQHLWGI